MSAAFQETNIVKFPGNNRVLDEKLEKELKQTYRTKITQNIPINNINSSAVILNDSVEVLSYNTPKLEYNESITGTITQKGASYMSSEYQALEQKVDLLMKQFDEKIANQEKLTEAKLDTVVSKMETFQASVLGEIKSSNADIKGEISTLKSDINTIKAEITSEIQTQITQSKKDTKALVWTATGVIATIATLIVTILIPILTK